MYTRLDMHMRGGLCGGSDVRGGRGVWRHRGGRGGVGGVWRHRGGVGGGPAGGGGSRGGSESSGGSGGSDVGGGPGGSRGGVGPGGWGPRGGVGGGGGGSGGGGGVRVQSPSESWLFIVPFEGLATLVTFPFEGLPRSLPNIAQLFDYCITHKMHAHVL